jgi:hypothetical protein
MESFAVRSSSARSGVRDRRPADDPDGVLVTRAQRGDRVAFEELTRRYSERL